jgi:hypothetical protein
LIPGHTYYEYLVWVLKPGMIGHDQEGIVLCLRAMEGHANMGGRVDDHAMSVPLHTGVRGGASCVYVSD